MTSDRSPLQRVVRRVGGSRRRGLQSRLDYVRNRLGASFWFVPGLMTLGSIVLAALTISVDISPVGLWMRDLAPWFVIDPQGARLALSTVAGAMITTASMVFSITVVALTLAAGNIGPRLLDRFMSDRVTQVALGLFLSTFVFSLLTLGSVREGDASFVPQIGVALSMLLSIFSFGWLIYFIHTLSALMQVDNAIARVGAGLIERVETSGDTGAAAERRATRAEALNQAEGGRPRHPVTAGGTGYIQAIDAGALLEVAVEHDLVIELVRRPGHFVIPTGELGTVHGSPGDIDAIRDEIRDYVIYGPRRTPAQDMEFSISLLVEIAGRALSPGVNDFYTAVASVDRLTAVLSAVFRNGLPGPVVCDDEGTPRVVLYPVTVTDIVDAAFDPIRPFAAPSVPVVLRLLDSLVKLTTATTDPDHRALLQAHGDRIAGDALAIVRNDHDAETIRDRHRRLRTACGRADADTEGAETPDEMG